jgi:hypothetical protein
LKDQISLTIPAENVERNQKPILLNNLMMHGTTNITKKKKSETIQYLDAACHA